MKTRNSHGLLQLHVGREALAYCQCLYRENKALFVSVDLIGEKNQVILEYIIILDIIDKLKFNVHLKSYLQHITNNQYPYATCITINL